MDILIILIIVIIIIIIIIVIIIIIIIIIMALKNVCSYSDNALDRTYLKQNSMWHSSIFLMEVRRWCHQYLDSRSI